MEKLIERMKTEGLNTAVLEMWYNDFKRNTEHCSQLYANDLIFINSRYYEKANELYENLHGFLFGLETLSYIDTELFEKYNGELINFLTFK